MDELKLIFASNLIRLRTAAGMTQAELGEQLNYSDKSISKWERGDGTPDIFILSHIASLYGITVQDLLREKKVAKTRTRHLLISLLSVGLVWLVMTVLFCGAQIFSICDRYAWLLFIYGIPISGIVAQVFCALWSNQLSQIFACSLIIWGIGLSLHLTAHGNRLFLVYVICAVLEVLLILLYTLRAQTRWREWREKRKKMQKSSDDSAA